jgi:hypothetical protein
LARIWEKALKAAMFSMPLWRNYGRLALLTEERNISIGYNQNMEITVMLSPWKNGSSVKVQAPSEALSIADLIDGAVSQFPRPLKKLLNGTIAGGSRLFLALSPTGPERLLESKCLRDYDLTDGSTVWLMCGHLKD